MRKILLVDDVPEQLMAYRRLLHRRFTIVSAGDGVAALELLKQHTDIQAIVSDMAMPCMNGIDFFVQAAEWAPHATRIMLTGNTDMNATIDAINRGRVFRYLKKPCSRDDLIDAIEDGLKLRSPRSNPSPSSLFSPSTTLPSPKAPVLEQLKTALREHTLQAFFQPIVDLRTSKIIGAEALARWRHPIDGWITPSIFIPIAEEYGLMPELGRSMLRAACRDAQAWHQQGFKGLVSINVSVTQLLENRLIDDVRQALDESGLSAESLTLELTESVMISDPSTVIQALEDLRKLGIALAIDDFGTGYSSLAYLKHLPIDRLKIDQCFVTDIDHDERDLAFVRAMLDLAKKLGLTVVAEGIERPEQHKILFDLGCNFGQGYLFGKALDSLSFQSLSAQGQSLSTSKAEG